MEEYTVVIKEGTYQWEENHTVPDKCDPEETIRKTIANFNEFNHRKYEFIKFKRIRKSEQRQIHDWIKSSLVTERGGFDKMKCTLCGATGKRYGLGMDVRPDAKFDRKYCVMFGQPKSK